MKKTEFVDSELEVIRFAEKDILLSSTGGTIQCTIESECELDSCGECGTHV